MKILRASILLGFLVSGSAMAADYSVGIVNPGAGFAGGGTALNLYETSDKGIRIVQTYVLQQYGHNGSNPTENLASPITLVMNPAHDFVYVAYYNPNYGLPNLVGFKITPTGLVFQWEQELSTGDFTLQGGTFTAGPDYVIETLYPIGPWIYVVNEAGVLVLEEVGEDTNLISAHVDLKKKFYFSCRGALPYYEETPTSPVTSVSVYKFVDGETVYVNETTPVATSTDPAYIQSVCN